jgi:DNA-binding transcriptional regulator YiaG
MSNTTADAIPTGNAGTKRLSMLKTWSSISRGGGLPLNGAQVRTARELVGLSQPALAVILQIGVRRIADFESGAEGLPCDILEYFRAAMEAAGVVFADGGDEGAGVRLNPPTR